MDDIVRETRIDAPPQRVWAVVTRAEHVARWFGDAGAEIDLRPGGAMRLEWKEHGVGLAVVERAEPITLFSFRWASEPGAEPTPTNSTLVEFRLKPEGDGTVLTVVESGFESLDDPDPQARRDDNVGGWEHEMNDLVTYLRQVAV